ncbi:MAG: hypothetical protein WCH30_00460 [Chlorobiaceae bacterium]
MLGAKREAYVSAKAIAVEQGMPYQFLRGVLQEMIRHNLILWKEGVHGGFAGKGSLNLTVNNVLQRRKGFF